MMLFSGRKYGHHKENTDVLLETNVGGLHVNAKKTKYSGTSISRTSRETKKNIRVIENSSCRNTFFLLIFQLNLHQAYVL
jgi:hypothetical protein